MRMRQVHNVQTGLIEEIEVDDAWMFANRHPLVLLSASSLSVAVNGSITLSAQLQREKADYSFENYSQNRTIQIQYGMAIVTVNLVNGFWQDSLDCTHVGSFEIYCPFIFDEATQLQNLGSNKLTIEVA